MFLLFSIIVCEIPYYNKCSYGTLCGNKCDKVFNDNVESHYTPTYNNYQPAPGCKINNMNLAPPNKFTTDFVKDPINQVICPNRISSGSMNNNKICGGLYYDSVIYESNNMNNGPLCSKSCIYDSQINKCVTVNKTCTINQSYGYKCPKGCSYLNNICYSSSSQIVCKPDTIKMKCPIDCTYNFMTNKCVPDNYDSVCDLEYGLKCSYDCKLNEDQNKCIIKENINCTSGPIGLCLSDKCTFNINKNKCVPDSPNDVCVSTIYSSCPEYYRHNITAPNCTIDNTNDLCYLNETTMRYPVFMKEDYKYLKCVYNYNVSCAGGKLQSCPNGCTINEALNKCESDEPNTLCGINFSTICPVNSTLFSQFGQCYQRRCNYTDNDIPNLECPYDYQMIKLKDYYYCINPGYLLFNL